MADFSSLQDYLSPRYLRNFCYRRYRDEKIMVHGIPRISPALFVSQLRYLNTRIFSWMVRLLVRKLHIDVVVGTFVVPPPQAPYLVFDLFDDNVSYWRSFGRVSSYANEIEQTEDLYMRSANATVAASSVLVDRVRQCYPNTQLHLIPNGIDLQHYNSLDHSAARRELGLSGCIVGAVGNHDKLAELEKILEAATLLAHEDITFLIVGRGAAIAAAREQARQARLSNVIFQGYLPAAEAATLVAALDVGLCPYLKTPGADAGSPMRLLMYAAVGLPTVCTDLQEVRRMNFSNVVLVDDNPAALAKGIQHALRLPRGCPLQLASYDIEQLTAKYEAVLQGSSTAG
jgi:hypothetical protein